MSTNQRSSRSTRTTAILSTAVVDNASFPISFVPSTSTMTSGPAVEIVAPGAKLPGISAEDLSLLRKKQKRLKQNASSTIGALPPGAYLRSALEASLIFAQEEAGSAVCIDPAGWIITCSHCFGDTEEEWMASKRKWLLFYNGIAVQAECCNWDPKRDLALLKVISIECSPRNSREIPIFHSVPLSSQPPSWRTPIVCIGQPGGDDLESKTARRTNYNLMEVSRGTTRGMIHGVDPQDNSEIGTLKHDAWTYWGHSGAPLLREADGTLVGLHSSWDDKTAMRHGIPLVAVKQFLEQNLPVAVESWASLNVAAGQPETKQKKPTVIDLESSDSVIVID